MNFFSNEMKTYSEWFREKCTTHNVIFLHPFFNENELITLTQFYYAINELGYGEEEKKEYA